MNNKLAWKGRNIVSLYPSYINNQRLFIFLRGAMVILLIFLYSGDKTLLSAQLTRPMMIEDLFNLQELSDVRLSPDSGTAAVIIKRAWSNPHTYRPWNMEGNDQADLWLISMKDKGNAKNVTNGASDGSGYWNPVWSPDGTKIALLSTKGGDNVRLYIWEKNSGRLRRITERGINIQTATSFSNDGTPQPIQWIDNTRLLVTVLPEGQQPRQFSARRQAQRVASETWKKTLQGKEATVSVLEGGIDVPEPAQQPELMLIDSSSGQSRILAKGNLQLALLSPDRSTIAVITQKRELVPNPDAPLGLPTSLPSQLGITKLDGSVNWVKGLYNPTVGFGMTPHQWSPDGSYLAVFASTTPEAGAKKTLFLVSSRDGTVRSVSNDLIVSSIAWTDESKLLALGRSSSEANQRLDWWALDFSESGYKPRKLTETLKSPPSQLIYASNKSQMIGIADGDLWSIAASGAVQNLTASFEPIITSFILPEDKFRQLSKNSSIIVRSRQGEKRPLYRLFIDTDSSVKTVLVDMPAPNATVSSYHSDKTETVFTAAQDPQGTFLWTRSGNSEGFALRLSLNEQLSGISEAKKMLIDYRASDGTEQKGLLLLPIGYEENKRYPLITWIYPGWIARSTSDYWVTKNHAHPDNLQIFSAQGYAVLLPSMPTGKTPRDPYLELPNGVIPAVDKVIEMGIADPEKVGLIGQSAGGFATYGLITQSKRFKAAVAIAGFANLISNYGTFNGETRYTDGITDKMTQAIFSEGSVIGLGSPPWADQERYIRNSPTLYLNRVETPLLIIHGDVDYVPMQQAEEVFTGLSRQGKRVRFVRYWGESHSTDSSANLRHRWQQILDWFGQYLKNST
ncbi:MAG: prolyl oligopeptidase family serine peptidase [Segetibacter sp.]|nr:prolyl oligopeptidase family serine peptidase [Segetibacter sp.]